MQHFWLSLVVGVLVICGCGGNASQSDLAAESKPRPVITAPCWKLDVHLAENNRLPRAADDTTGFSSGTSKYAEPKKQTQYVDNLRHRLADTYGLLFADNCFSYATIDVTLFVSNLSVSYIQELGPDAWDSGQPNDNAEGALSALHRPPPTKKTTRSFDDIMRVEVRFADPAGAAIVPMTISKNTGAKAVADTIATYLHLRKK